MKEVTNELKRLYDNEQLGNKVLVFKDGKFAIGEGVDGKEQKAGLKQAVKVVLGMMEKGVGNQDDINDIKDLEAMRSSLSLLNPDADFKVLSKGIDKFKIGVQ